MSAERRFIQRSNSSLYDIWFLVHWALHHISDGRIYFTIKCKKQPTPQSGFSEVFVFWSSSLSDVKPPKLRVIPGNWWLMRSVIYLSWVTPPRSGGAVHTYSLYVGCVCVFTGVCQLRTVWAACYNAGQKKGQRVLAHRSESEERLYWDDQSLETRGKQVHTHVRADKHTHTHTANNMSLNHNKISRIFNLFWWHALITSEFTSISWHTHSHTRCIKLLSK